MIYSKGNALPDIGGVCNLFETGAGYSLAKQYHRWGQDVNTCRYYIEYFSRVGELVVDPFVGGGTTIVAAKLIGRKAFGFDIDPEALLSTKNRILEIEIPGQSPLFDYLSEK